MSFQQLGQRFEVEAPQFCLRLQLQTLQSSALGVETVVTTPRLPRAAQRHHDPHHPGTASGDQLAVAQDEFESALALDGNHAGANYAMAVLSWSTSQPREAESFFKKAMSASPDEAGIRRDYGRFLCSEGRNEEGMRQLEKVLAIPTHPDEAMAQAAAGVCVVESDPDRAEGFFRAALKAEPTLGAALYNMAVIQYDRGEYLSARAFLERYFASNRETPESLLYAARVETALGDQAVAEDYRMRLRTRFPQSPEVQEVLGTHE